MKNMRSVLALFVLMALLAGCGGKAPETPETQPEPSQTTEAATQPTEETTLPTEAEPEPTEEENFVYEGDASTYYINQVYPDQIRRYYTPLAEQWTEGQYFESDLSAMPFYYHGDSPLDNVGFTFADLDGDGDWELIIGAILGAETDPVIFEIWTLNDGVPTLLLQGASRNRYYLQYSEDLRQWTICQEASNGAANFAHYYMTLNDGRIDTVQGVIYDAVHSPEEPWFMTKDLDWDVSNDTPIDETLGLDLIQANKDHYLALEYFPYSLYRPGE